jgi:hypothetical protein
MMDAADFMPSGVLVAGSAISILRANGAGRGWTKDDAFSAAYFRSAGMAFSSSIIGSMYSTGIGPFEAAAVSASTLR